MSDFMGFIGFELMALYETDPIMYTELSGQLC